MAKIIDKAARRKMKRVYVQIRDTKSKRSTAFTLEGLTYNQTIRAMAKLELKSGMDSIGVQGSTKDNAH